MKLGAQKPLSEVPSLNSARTTRVGLPARYLNHYSVFHLDLSTRLDLETSFFRLPGCYLDLLGQ